MGEIFQQRQRTVQATLKEFVCPECLRSVLRPSENHRERSMDWTLQDTVCAPTLWPHRCAACGALTPLATAYPQLLHGGEVWILEKSARQKIEAVRALLRRVHRD